MDKSTLCWDCRRSTEKTCDWAREFKPVKGWNAQETERGYLVYDCPCFYQDAWEKGRYRSKDEYDAAMKKRAENQLKKEQRRMNSLTIIGNLTGDPELRTTQTGKEVCSFTVAVNRRGKKDANGKDQADFFRVSVWEPMAKYCQQYLAKGRKVAVTGTVSVNTYTASDGTTRASMEVSAKDVEFLSSKSETTDGQTGYAKVNPEGNPFMQQQMDSLPWE